MTLKRLREKKNPSKVPRSILLFYCLQLVTLKHKKETIQPHHHYTSSSNSRTLLRVPIIQQHLQHDLTAGNLRVAHANLDRPLRIRLPAIS